ncbi:MAG: Na+/H+ antiporter NhaC family protein [Lachnospiraceae bacterium]|nr:Na+/H+ antiporter NhaC family protein [Lachnospiraceae bacterium]
MTKVYHYAILKMFVKLQIQKKTEDEKMDWNADIWSIVPPIIAIVLALVTKEVVFSLIMGILSGTVIFSVLKGLGVMGAFNTLVTIMCDKLGSNSSMIIFLCFLGIIVSLVTKAGGSKAYGEWASKKLRGKRTASLATVALGVLIFIDDYFNCLTVGTVMRPVTDKFKMSREKLAYIIDATAAPVCIIAPISSWAASVISYYPESSGSGIEAFVKSIPMNLYAVLTLFMVIWVSTKKNADFGPMAKAEKRALLTGDLGAAGSANADEDFEKATKKDATGKVSDLVFPIATLIILSIFSMIYVGGFFENTKGSMVTRIFDAFGNTDAGMALALGAFMTLIITFIYYLARKVLTFKEYFECITPGVASMVPACIILTLAWTISGICRDEYLNTGGYVAQLVQQTGFLIWILAPVIFLIACLLSFATGTAWGTFGILIPIVISITNKVYPEFTIICLSATLAGSVFGDHCSPISDTTILASTGADCNHLSHVGTQAPYAVTVAICCFIGYIIAGFTTHIGFSYAASAVTTVLCSVAILIALLLVLPKVWQTKEA